MTSGLPQAERHHFLQGPFWGRMDPWAEAAHYFRSIHTGFIGGLLNQIQAPLYDLGYVAGRETSLQIVDGREPDLYIEPRLKLKPGSPQWDYALAAEEVLAPAGIIAEFEDELDAIHIRDNVQGDLVTVVEIISPGNKINDPDILAYQERRKNLYIRRGVNYVEIDATRSIKRVTRNSVTDATPYHIAVFIPGYLVRIIEIPFDQPLGRFALPLRDAVLPVELHDTYVYAYQQPMIAWHIEHEGSYTAENLPFPTLLTDAQKAAALAAVEKWRAELARSRAAEVNDE